MMAEQRPTGWGGTWAPYPLTVRQQAVYDRIPQADDEAVPIQDWKTADQIIVRELRDVGLISLIIHDAEIKKKRLARRLPDPTPWAIRRQNYYARDMLVALRDVLEIFEDQEDVKDGGWAGQIPNDAMRACMIIRAVIAAVEGKTS